MTTLGDKVNRLAELSQQKAELDAEFNKLRSEVDQEMKALTNPQGRGRKPKNGE